jgi:hypothetical protein
VRTDRFVPVSGSGGALDVERRECSGKRRERTVSMGQRRVVRSVWGGNGSSLDVDRCWWICASCGRRAFGRRGVGGMRVKSVCELPVGVGWRKTGARDASSESG